MNIKKILSENLFCIFLSLCSTIIAETELLRAAGYSLPLAAGITSVFSLLVVFIIYLNRKNSAAYILAAAVFTLVLSALNLLGISVVEFPAEAFGHFFAAEELMPGEIVLITSLMSLILSALFFPLTHIRAVRYAAAGLSLAMLIFFGFNNIAIDPIEVFAAAGLILCALTDLSLGFMYRGEPYKKLRGVLSFLLPLFAAFSVAAAAIPFSEEPISWQFVKNIATGIADLAKNISDELALLFNPRLSEFDIGMQGYSDADGGFGGGLTAGTAEQLIISSTTPMHASVYLIGSVSDLYTGSGWKKSTYSSFSDRDYFLDYCETVCALERAEYKKDELSSFVARSVFTVEYGDILTKAVFYPLKTTNIKLNGAYNAEAPTIALDGRATEGLKYNINCLELNYRSDELRGILRGGFTYNTAAALQKHPLDSNISVGIERDLQQRAEYIEKAFTVLPDTVTDRTRELADMITKGCTNDYDKLCAIEAYLRGYAYTLTPGAVPDGFDAVDYFLFENKEGYCTYFASAMAVLARCEGIPTRYVQGFSVDCASRSALKSHTVTSSSAHAWAEGYIEGFGWIPFEPTAAGSDGRYNYLGSSLSSDYESYPFQFPENTAYDPLPAEEAEQTPNNTSLYIIILCFALLGAVILFAAYIIARMRGFFKTYHGGSDTDKFMTCYKIIFYLFEKDKLTRENAETADSFAKRASTLSGSAEFSEITKVFNRIRYGDGKAAESELAAAESCLRELYGKYTEKRGRLSSLKLLAGYCMKQQGN